MDWFEDTLLSLQSTNPKEMKHNLLATGRLSLLRNPVSTTDFSNHIKSLKLERKTE